MNPSLLRTIEYEKLIPAGCRLGLLLLASTVLLFVWPAVANADPERLVITGVPTVEESHNLSCEYAAASAVTMFWGNAISQADFIREVPQNANPHFGFRGNIDAPFGGTENYGVYAEALVPVLQRRGYSAEVFYGGVDRLKSELVQGHPVVVWITTREDSYPHTETYNGLQFTLVPYEHAIVVYGFDGNGVFTMNVGDGRYWPMSWSSFLHRWAYFDDMGLVIIPQEKLLSTNAPPNKVTPLSIARLFPQVDAAQLDWRVFPETGYLVYGRFWNSWQSGRSFNDSLRVNGLPISALHEEVSPLDGKIYQTQWFERARFEYHPENAPPNDVLLSRLGVTELNATPISLNTRSGTRSDPGGGAIWFQETGHTLGDSSEGGMAIASFWTKEGGIPQFGYPISQPFLEANKGEGNTYLVQYFERARLEYHPEQIGTDYEVQVGRLGFEQINNEK